ncbi:MAG: alpha/beta hydrolase [Beijerinckiaceae bacterium]
MLKDTLLKLAPREEHYRIASHHEGLNLFLRHLAPEEKRQAKRVVLYVHGATFSSGLSIAHRFDGRSWRDELCAKGFDVWGLDFHGFGCLSDPHPAMNEPAEQCAALGRAEDASCQLEQAARFITARHGVDRLSLIAHSWGTMAAGRFAGRCPALVERLVFFGPITWRQKKADAPRLPAWKIVTPAQQWNRFVQDVPGGHPPVLLKRHFDLWSELYLDCDPEGRMRVPAGVKIPLGPLQDIADAWAGALTYEPGLIRAPVAILRGEWDSLTTDADARWLFAALTAVPLKRDVKISKAGHLMHLEESRYALYREAETFLLAGDEPSRAAESATLEIAN